jgi:hypothetical protein
MRNPARNIRRSDRVERLFDGVEQRLKCARLGASPIRFDLRPTLLDGVKSGA